MKVQGVGVAYFRGCLCLLFHCKRGGGDYYFPPQNCNSGYRDDHDDHTFAFRVEVTATKGIQ
jgi:hypothetical protein